MVDNTNTKVINHYRYPGSIFCCREIAQRQKDYIAEALRVLLLLWLGVLSFRVSGVRAADWFFFSAQLSLAQCRGGLGVRD